MKKGEDLQRRTFAFACAIVEVHDVLIERRPAIRVLANQLLRSGTAIGSNLEEADAAQSTSDFIAKCCISLKEARETHYWLRLLRATKKLPDDDHTAALVGECDELVAILTVIIRTTREHRDAAADAEAPVGRRAARGAKTS
jgi:four helix bundle protein